MRRDARLWWLRVVVVSGGVVAADLAAGLAVRAVPPAVAGDRWGGHPGTAMP